MSGLDSGLRRLGLASSLACAAFASWSVAGFQISAGLAVATVIALALRGQRQANPLYAPALLFIGAAAMAWVLNPMTPTADSSMPRIVLGLWVASCVALSGDAGAFPKRAFWLSATLVLSAAAVSILALYQVKTGFDLLHALHFRSEPFRTEAPDRPGLYAALGAFSKRLTFAHVVAVIAAFAGGALVHGGLSRRWKAVFAGAGCLMAAGVVAAYARSALLSLAGGMVIAVLLLGKRARKAILPIAAVVLALGIALVVIPGTAERIARTLNLQSNQDRLFIWNRAGEMLALCPTFGVGPGAYPEVAKPTYDFADPRFPMHTWAHDAFVSLWLETGVLGLVAFVSIFFLFFVTMRGRLDSGDPLLSAIRVGAVASTATYLLLCVFHDLPYSVEPSGVAFLLMGVATIPTPAEVAT